MLRLSTLVLVAIYIHIGSSCIFTFVYIDSFAFPIYVRLQGQKPQFWKSCIRNNCFWFDFITFFLNRKYKQITAVTITSNFFKLRNRWTSFVWNLPTLAKYLVFCIQCPFLGHCGAVIVRSTSRNSLEKVKLFTLLLVCFDMRRTIIPTVRYLVYFVEDEVFST